MPEESGAQYGRRIMLEEVRKDRKGFAASRDALLEKQRTEKITKKERQELDTLGQLLAAVDGTPEAGSGMMIIQDDRVIYSDVVGSKTIDRMAWDAMTVEEQKAWQRG